MVIYSEDAYAAGSRHGRVEGDGVAGTTRGTKIFDAAVKAIVVDHCCLLVGRAHLDGTSVRADATVRLAVPRPCLQQNERGVSEEQQQPRAEEHATSTLPALHVLCDDFKQFAVFRGERRSQLKG